MSTRTLVLTSWYFPHKIIGWQDAITLMYLQKVDVIVSYDEIVRSPSVSLQVPAVVRLKRKVAVQKKRVKFSRLNVYVRDDCSCAYCGSRLAVSQFTYDHVLPRSRGGRTVWENIVTACVPCNSRKGNRTPEECGMRLLRPPHRPSVLPLLPPSIDPAEAPPEWRDFVQSLPQVGAG